MLERGLWDQTLPQLTDPALLSQENTEPRAPGHPDPAPTVPAPQGITAAPRMPWEPELLPTDQTALSQSRRAARPSPGWARL